MRHRPKTLSDITCVGYIPLGRKHDCSDPYCVPRIAQARVGGFPRFAFVDSFEDAFVFGVRLLGRGGRRGGVGEVVAEGHCGVGWVGWVRGKRKMEEIKVEGGREIYRDILSQIVCP